MMRLLMVLCFVMSSALLSAVDLAVMSYNLRFASETGPQAWSLRRPLVADVIRRAAPDVIGTQEGLYSQIKDLAADLPDYAWIGLGRDGGSRGELMAVYYRRAELEPIAFDHFWLSDTPESMGSATWGHHNRRMVTWVKFQHRATGRQFYVWNTHFDHEVQAARERSAWLIRQRVAELRTEEPVILLGDFNAAAEQNPVYDILVGDGTFRDSWTSAQRRSGEGLGTFNGFGATPPQSERIDWILVRGTVRVTAAAIVADRPDQQYPSDHDPVTAQLILPDPPAR